MSLWELFIIAVALSMDAFAVTVCKGLSVKTVKLNYLITAGIYFGGFQALMPLIGYFLGSKFQFLITSIAHWIAFALLLIIGISMIKESREEAECVNNSFGVSAMLPLAVATSIDALAVGVTFAFLQVNIAAAVIFIGIITFLLSAVGIKVGNFCGEKYKAKSELLGGIILILMAIKILMEHFLG